MSLQCIACSTVTPPPPFKYAFLAFFERCTQLACNPSVGCQTKYGTPASLLDDYVVDAWSFISSSLVFSLGTMDSLFRLGAPGWHGVSVFAHEVWECDVDPRGPPPPAASSLLANIFSSAGDLVVRGFAYAVSRLLPVPVPAPVRAATMSSTQAVIERQAMLMGIIPEALCRPLPLDTVNDRILLMPQLLGSWGPDLHRFASTIVAVAASGPQEANVIIGSAASGVGKTHLAYAWGVDNGFSILGRAITSNLSADIAPPFVWLLAQLRTLLLVPAGSATAVSAAAFLFVRLTLLSFVHFSVLALRALRSSHPEASTHDLRQLLLRMHRNGKADALITDILNALVIILRVKRWRANDEDIFELDGAAMRIYEASLSIAAAESMGHAILFTVDEAHELMERRECHAVDSLFLSRRSRPIAGGASALLQEITAPRSLFYAIVLELSSLQTMYGISVYVTGTALSMHRVLDSSSASVATRCHPLDFAPEHRFDVSDIVTILRHYWAFDGVLTDPLVNQHLANFVGRPQLFVVGVFAPLFFVVRDLHRLPNPAELVEMLSCSFRSCVRDRKLFFVNLFQKNTTVNVDGSGTVQLIPMVFRAAVMHDGIITLSNEDQLAEAICTGLLAVSSARAPGPVDMRAEPVVYQAMRSAMLDPLLEGRVLDVLMRSSQSTAVFAKGGALEIAISWHVALTCYRLTEPSLAAVLVTLGVKAEVIPPDMKLWAVRASRVYDDGQGQAVRPHRGSEELTPFQRYFIAADGGIDDSRVVYNIPVAQGGDMVFLVSREAPLAVDAAADTNDICNGRQYRPVVFQFKNVEAATVAETLLTLQPGTQFLQNIARKCLLHMSDRVFSNATQSGWIAWEALSRDPRMGFLARNWVRIAVVARPLESDISKFSLAAAIADEDDSHVHSWTASQRDLAARSPVVWVSLAEEFAKCDSVFPDTVRRAIISPTPPGGAAGGVAQFQPSRMTLRHHDLWVPVVVSKAAELVARIEVEASAAEAAAGAGSKRHRVVPPAPSHEASKKKK